MRGESVVVGHDADVLRGWIPPRARVLDVTANARRLWRSSDCTPICFDIDGAFRPDARADFRALPVPAASIDVLVYDPPHLPTAAASPQSDQDFARRFGLAAGFHDGGSRADAESAPPFLAPFLAEAVRVLRPDGLLLAKLCDYVHSHRYVWALVNFVNAVRGVDGLTACDMIVKRTPGGHLMSSRWVAAHHVRRVHAYWIKVRRGRCEPRKVSP